jgi:hypothetical protein
MQDEKRPNCPGNRAGEQRPPDTYKGRAKALFLGAWRCSDRRLYRAVLDNRCLRRAARRKGADSAERRRRAKADKDRAAAATGAMAAARCDAILARRWAELDKEPPTVARG